MGALRREREFSGAAALLQTLLIHLLSGCSLRATATQARQRNLANVSAVALLKRLNLAGEWFRWMAVELLRTSRAECDRAAVRRRAPQQLRAVDSARVGEPGSKGTSGRIHYCFDMNTLECTEFRLTANSTPETFSNFAIQPGAVYAAGKEYCSPEGILHVVKNNGHVLTPMGTDGPALLDPDGGQFDLPKHLRDLKGARIGDWPVSCRSLHGPVVHGRAIGRQLATPDLLDRERPGRRKSISAKAIESAEHVCIFTTLSATKMPVERAIETLRQRGQLDAVLKRMELLLRLGHFPNQDTEGAKAWMQGKLFCAVLNEVIGPDGGASPSTLVSQL